MPGGGGALCEVAVMRVRMAGMLAVIVQNLAHRLDVTVAVIGLVSRPLINEPPASEGCQAGGFVWLQSRERRQSRHQRNSAILINPSISLARGFFESMLKETSTPT